MRKTQICCCSSQLDPVARAHPNHLKAVAAAAELVEASAELLLEYDLHLQVLHVVEQSIKL